MAADRKIIKPLIDTTSLTNEWDDLRIDTPYGSSLVQQPRAEAGGAPTDGSQGPGAGALPPVGGPGGGDASPAAFATVAVAPKPAAVVGGTTPVQPLKTFTTAADLPTDSLFASQWHLLNTGQTGGVKGVDLDVLGAWKKGLTGKGVSVGVFDTAMDVKHTDLAANIDMSKAIVAGGVYVDPTILTASDQHATAVAGLIAAARNGSGAVGVAYDAKVTPVDIFGNNQTYAWQSLWQQNKFDVTNHSWGFTAAFVVGQLDAAAQYWVLSGFKTGADTGRGGLGTIETVAAGNFRQNGLTTETNGLTIDRHAVVVGAIDDKGSVTYYSNPGASLLVNAPSSGNTSGIVTDDVTGSLGYSSGNYTNTFGGTSAATPEVAGVEALILQANSKLGWRDMQDILAITARHTGSAVNDVKHGYELDTWAFNHATTWNAGGYHFSNDYGFGLVDARAAVALAQTWSLAFPTAHTSANELLASASVAGSWDVGHAKTNTLTFTIGAHQSIESMVVDLTDLKASYGGHLIIDLISPTGTVSNLLNQSGGATAIAAGWELMSREFRGEDAFGTWTLRITDTTASDTGSLTKATLKAYGGAATDNSVFFFTDEFIQYATATSKVAYAGGPATIDAAPISGDMVLNLLTGTGTIDGKAITVAAGTVVQTVIGGDGNNSVVGNNAGDRLYGGLGTDVLTGGTGADLLDGRGGSNTLTGGAGADKFAVHAGAFSAIADFALGVDKILVAAAEFGGALLDGLQTKDFVYGTGTTHIAGGGFVYDAAASVLWWDKDGSSALTQVARLDNHVKLAFGDFLLA
ncbi:MAG: S8 family serine peptidase [Alsobacter sp.]